MIEENNENERKPKKIEIVKGNSKDLNISNVKDSLIIEKPEEKQNQKEILFNINKEAGLYYHNNLMQILESQNGMGWGGISKVICFHPLATDRASNH